MSIEQVTSGNDWARLVPWETPLGERPWRDTLGRTPWAERPCETFLGERPLIFSRILDYLLSNG